jgi:L-lactate dehydrogenase complex protein LldG
MVQEKYKNMRSSREHILSCIRENRPIEIELVNQLVASGSAGYSFSEAVERSGGVVQHHINDHRSYISQVFSNIPEDHIVDLTKMESSNDLMVKFIQEPKLVIISASLGVIENGAVLIDLSNGTSRTLPFICEHLVVLVQSEHIVETMQEAYGAIGNVPKYFVFISGPSKTADIEQSLVIGAHGPKSLTVLIQ